MAQPTTAGSMPLTMLVAGEVERISPDATLREVATKMHAFDLGALAIGDGNGRPDAIVTERDLVRALAEGSDPATTTAGDIGSTGLIWCDSGATVADAAQEMVTSYVRHVLVEDDGALVGIVSARDVMGAYVAADVTLDDQV
jgi:CBS domain-containing protein